MKKRDAFFIEEGNQKKLKKTRFEYVMLGVVVILTVVFYFIPFFYKIEFLKNTLLPLLVNLIASMFIIVTIDKRNERKHNAEIERKLNKIYSNLKINTFMPLRSVFIKIIAASNTEKNIRSIKPFNIFSDDGFNNFIGIASEFDPQKEFSIFDGALVIKIKWYIYILREVEKCLEQLVEYFHLYFDYLSERQTEIFTKIENLYFRGKGERFSVMNNLNSGKNIRIYDFLKIIGCDSLVQCMGELCELLLKTKVTELDVNYQEILKEENFIFKFGSGVR